jgi:hypothetical protein
LPLQTSKKLTFGVRTAPGATVPKFCEAWSPTATISASGVITSASASDVTNIAITTASVIAIENLFFISHIPFEEKDKMFSFKQDLSYIFEMTLP